MNVEMLVNAEILDGMEMIVATTETIVLEFAVGLGYAVDVLTGARAVVITDIVSGVDVAILTDANDLAAATTALEFTSPAPGGDTLLVSSAAFSCCC